VPRLLVVNLALALLLALAAARLPVLATVSGLALSIGAAALLYLCAVHITRAADLGELRAALSRRSVGRGSAGAA
jgi:hypothetical protein